MENPGTHAAAPPMFRPRRLAHANIFVSDIARSLPFYHHVCGLEIVSQGGKSAFFSNGSSHHDVACLASNGEAVIGSDGHVQVPKGRGKTPGLNHFGWEMETEQELVAAYRRACAVDLPIHRVSDHTLSRSIYVFDPDGNLHELYSDSTPDWRGIYSSPRPLKGYTFGWTPNDETASTARNYHADPDFRSVPSAVFHSLRLERATVVTRNFPRMRDFYVNVIGMQVVSEDVAASMVSLAGGLGKIDVTLIGREPQERHGLHHCSFSVRDEAGLIEGERRYQAEFGQVDRSLDLPHKRSTFVRDPDGLLTEFFSPRSGAAGDIAAVAADLRRYLA